MTTAELLDTSHLSVELRLSVMHVARKIIKFRVARTEIRRAMSAVREDT